MIDFRQGDCAVLLRGIPDASVDAVVTDPPFGIGYRFGGKPEPARNAADYWRWFAPLHAEVMRCLKPGGFCAIWQTQLYFRHFWEWYGPDIHIFCAAKNFVQLRATPINYAYDPIVCSYKSGATARRPTKPARNLDFFVANMAALVSHPERLERAHPSPKPLDLMEALIANFTMPGGMVLDPFAGSGSTGIAAMRQGRDFVGIEIEPDYVALAKRRLAQENGESTSS